MKKIKISGLVIVTVMMTTICSAQNMSKETTVEVGGAPMYPSKNIIENAVNSKDHSSRACRDTAGKWTFYCLRSH